MQSHTSQPKQRPILLIAFITIFLDLLGFGIIIPIQAFYAESFGASPTEVTMLGAIFSGMQFLFASFWGRLSDRIGRKPVILSSIAIAAVGYIMFGAAQSLLMLFVARAISGFGSANIAAAQALISDVTTKENRAKGMGLVGAAFGLGFILGPALGGLAGQISPVAPAYLAGVMCIINFFLAWYLLPETLSASRRSKGRRLFSLQALRDATRYANVAAILAVTALMISAFAMMEHTVGLYIEHLHVDYQGLNDVERIRQASRLTAYYLVAVGVVATIIQGGFIGRLSGFFGEVKLIRVGIFIQCIRLACLPYIISLGMPWMLLSAILLACGTGITHPSISSLLSKSVADNEQGGTLGLNQSLGSLGRVIGPTMAGPIYTFNPSSTFMVSSAVMAVAFLATMRIRK